MKKPISKPTLRAILTLGMISAACPELFRLDLELLSRHMAIFGGTGSGKTKLSVLLIRQLITYGVGVTIVTPHPDARDELLQWCAVNNIDPSRIIDLKPGEDCCPSLDPFAHVQDKRSALEAAVSRLISAMLRNVPLADQQVMTRMRRWLKNALYCCGVRVDGEYIGLQKALVFLDPDHPEYEESMGRVRHKLPDHMRADFRMLEDIDGPVRRLQLVESAMNRLRDVVFDNPHVTQMLARNPKALNFEEVILQSKIVLASVPEGELLSRDQANVIAAMRRRFEGLFKPDWTPAMVRTINRKGVQHFRWHDSGDVQSVEHLLNIATVAKYTPATRHWLPTRECEVVRAALREVVVFPENLLVRVSAHMIGDPGPKGFANTSTVHANRPPRTSHLCPAPDQGNKCGDCRACWDPEVKDVAYWLH